MTGLGKFLGTVFVFFVLAASISDQSIDPGGVANNIIGMGIRFFESGLEEIQEGLPGGD